MFDRYPVFQRALFELRWQVLWYGLGLALYGAAMVLLFPQFEEFAGEMAANYPEELLAFFGGGDLSHPAGFMTLEYQSFSVLILIIYAAVASTGLLAGEEGRGTLESLLAEPIGRTRLIVEKGTAFLVGALLICGIICVGWGLSVPFVDFHGELTLLDLTAATFGALPILLLFGALGFWLGALAPSRSVAAGLLIAVAVGGYLASSLALSIQPIGWVRYLSPYYYSDAARWLTDGPVWWHQVVLLAGAAFVFALAVRTFAGREVGRSSWQGQAITRRWRAA